MRIEIEVSDKNESTSFPWWVIIDAGHGNSYGVPCGDIKNLFHGPFFSREAAEAELESRRYDYSRHAYVYCKSGYVSSEYVAAFQAAREKQQCDQK